MKILFLALVCLTGSYALAQDVQDVPENQCNWDRKSLVNSGLVTDSSLPDCLTPENRKTVERVMIAQGTTTGSYAQPQPKKQDSPAAPKVVTNDPNKTHCSISPLGSTDAISWEECLKDANTMYCDKKDQLQKNQFPLVMFSKGGKVENQKQLTEDSFSCSEKSALKTKPSAPKSHCSYNDHLVGVTPESTMSFISIQQCVEYIRENYPSPPGKCVFEGTSYGTYDLKGEVLLVDFHPPGNKGPFSFTNVPCKPPTKSKALPANFGQPASVTQPAAVAPPADSSR